MSLTATSRHISDHILEDIKRLRLLRPGWMEDRSGETPSAESLDWFQRSEGLRIASLAENLPLAERGDLPSASVFASPEGHIEIEWWGRDKVFTLTIDADSHTGHWHRTYLAQKTYDSGNTDLQTPEGWETVETELLRTF